MLHRPGSLACEVAWVAHIMYWPGPGWHFLAVRFFRALVFHSFASVYAAHDKLKNSSTNWKSGLVGTFRTDRNGAKDGAGKDNWMTHIVLLSFLVPSFALFLPV